MLGSVNKSITCDLHSQDFMLFPCSLRRNCKKKKKSYSFSFTTGIIHPTSSIRLVPESCNNVSSVPLVLSATLEQRALQHVNIFSLSFDKEWQSLSTAHGVSFHVSPIEKVQCRGKYPFLSSLFRGINSSPVEV